MSQVVIEMSPLPMPSSGQAQVPPIRGVLVEEITSSGTSQATTITAASNGDYVSIANNGTDAIWAAVKATAAAGSGVFIRPNERRDYGPLSEGDTISVINDS